jgi:DNA mismatch endonuclease, patch repair protein
MRANRRKDTKPELALRRALHSQGYRYRKDYRLDLASGTRVRPDIAFTARKVAVFVDGCFWHGCPQHGSRPAVNVWYWEPKLRRNAERDRSADAALAAAGWAVVRVWEHEPLDGAVAAVVAALRRAAGLPAGGLPEGASPQAGTLEGPLEGLLEGRPLVAGRLEGLLEGRPLVAGRLEGRPLVEGLLEGRPLVEGPLLEGPPPLAGLLAEELPADGEATEDPSDGAPVAI